VSAAVPRFSTQQTLLTTGRKGYKVELIVVHETAGGAPGDLNFLVGSKQKSVNWYIDPVGKIICLDADQATAHAGVCVWRKHTDPAEEKEGWGWANLASEGIEVSGPNNGRPFTDAQFRSLTELVRWRLDVNKLAVANLVRHADIAWKKGRKNDPLGLDWIRFRGQFIGTPPAPPTERTVAGAGGKAFKCSAAFADFYDAHGGLLVFGFATTNMYQSVDPDGEACEYMEFENAVLKRKPSMPAAWSLRPILLAEAMSRASALGG
jgi:N-acetyl-anhydromuramyl-L-alanine amidase AmpD